MSYAEKKRSRREAEQNTDIHDYSWEEENTPTLHSGFIEPTTENPPRSRLSLHLYFDGGRYWCRIEDRVDQEQAFTTVSSLESVFKEIERSLETDDLIFRPTRQSRNGYAAR